MKISDYKQLIKYKYEQIIIRRRRRRRRRRVRVPQSSRRAGTDVLWEIIFL
jgi:hypothetical protein